MDFMTISEKGLSHWWQDSQPRRAHVRHIRRPDAQLRSSRSETLFRQAPIREHSRSVYASVKRQGMHVSAVRATRAFDARPGTSPATAKRALPARGILGPTTEDESMSRSPR